MVNKFSSKQQGLFSLALGAILLLYALGVFGRGVNVIVVVIAACLIAFGFLKMGLHREVMDVVKRIKHKR